ncbi:MAG: LLM class flavin-dependent oxidoreductase [Halioglobus sp.]|nr:LLM class flavin-dependent oxidoreductase [Halioglobus sp.]
MDLSCSLPPSAAIVSQVQLAESLGYQRVWVSDSPALYSDPWAALALAATGTTRIGLGVAVLTPSTRHVMANAAAIAGIEALAPGRLAVAVGTGFTARRLFGKTADVGDHRRLHCPVARPAAGRNRRGGRRPLPPHAPRRRLGIDHPSTCLSWSPPTAPWG